MFSTDAAIFLTLTAIIDGYCDCLILHTTTLIKLMASAARRLFVVLLYIIFFNELKELKLRHRLTIKLTDTIPYFNHNLDGLMKQNIRNESTS